MEECREEIKIKKILCSKTLLGSAQPSTRQRDLLQIGFNTSLLRSYFGLNL